LSLSAICTCKLLRAPSLPARWARPVGKSSAPDAAALPAMSTRSRRNFFMAPSQKSELYDIIRDPPVPDDEPAQSHALRDLPAMNVAP
jgi:hypothetical protein